MALNKIPQNKKVQAAVMVLKELESDSLILTKRSIDLHHHPGEICFPGGKLEPGDKNLYAAGQRELYEELGIKAGRITLIKKLHIEQTLLGTTIHPWYVRIDSIRPYCQNPAEVTALIFIPMSLVVDPQNYRELIVERRGVQFKSCEFIPNEELVWGATARIMKQLSAVD